MKHLWILPLLLAACSNSGEQPFAKTVWSAVKAQREAAKAPPPVKSTPPRAEIDRLNVAMIQLNLEGEPVWPILLPAVRNGPFVTYATKTRQTVTLRESQVTGIRGMGTDLLAAESSDTDPLKRLTPPDRWPSALERRYRFAGDGPLGREEVYACHLTRGADTTITLAGTVFDVARFDELCRGPAGVFQNAYAADLRDGRVWQSRQWVGPDMAPLNLDILEPLTE